MTTKDKATCLTCAHFIAELFDKEVPEEVKEHMNEWGQCLCPVPSAAEFNERDSLVLKEKPFTDCPCWQSVDGGEAESSLTQEQTNRILDEIFAEPANRAELEKRLKEMFGEGGPGNG
jgi:hypothetical protein